MEDDKFENLLEEIMETLGIDEEDFIQDHIVDGTLTDVPPCYLDTIH